MDPATVAPSSIPKPIAEILRLFITGILPAIHLTILCGAWIGVLVCILLALIHFSTKDQRRRPLFIMNVIAICIGLLCNILEILRGTVNSVNTTSPNDRPTLYTLVSLCGLSVIFTDSILLFRLVVVFPSERTSRRTLLLIFGPLALIKIGRLVTTIVYLVILTAKMNTTETTTQFYIIATTLTEPKVLWGIQLLDNG
ncbi:hypothetical protein K435DRAFT_754120 [Dendrothele bispora CBS 962.96]|uniref:G-protein coupled receptors family 1 profile domain-containing protein n=1 Tax=Dendrothele bispora (strain CBS 962.96) TaxID=1314807 RepID=A0A4S8M578_DENBC|nr:hypothetical protein K435DRAFT_754120 [Dendrothele bispora CBS 962.96]